MGYRTSTRITGCALIVLAAALFVAGPVRCDETDSKASGYWSIQFENDSLSSSPNRNYEDGNYTNGLQYSRLRVGHGLEWITVLGDRLPFYNLYGEKTAVSYTFGQQVFTPDDTRQEALIPDDRPYAVYLYFKTALLSGTDQSPGLQTGNILEVTFGIVGPASGAERIQTWFHKVIGTRRPMGWQNQLNNEPGADISYTRI